MIISVADHHAMHQQGYCLDLHDDGFRLKRIPASTAFKDDAGAWLHIFDQAQKGESLAIRVLEFLADHGPLEFQLIGQYVGIYRRRELQEHATQE